MQAFSLSNEEFVFLIINLNVLQIVQDALEKAQQGRTCIIIAHRLSTIKNCDTIFVVQNGLITESGSHDQLMKTGGFYAKLNEQQGQ